jgi:glucokinase
VESAGDELTLEVNEYLVLDAVRERGETNRAEVGRELGLSAASVSRTVRRLIAKGLVMEMPGISSGGRPRSLLRFNPLAGAVIGVDLGGDVCRALLADLSGRVVAEEVRRTGRDPMRSLAACVTSLQQSAVSVDLPVIALAVGVAAIVDPATGMASGGPTVRWHDFPIVGRLAESTDLPFVVENDVNLAALGHAWRGAARGASDFVVLSIGNGIGAGVVCAGQLLKGKRGAAGEIGYLALDRDQLEEPPVDGRGAFERLASESALISRLERSPHVPSGAREAGAGSTVALTALFGDPAGQTPWLRALADEVLDHAAMAIVSLGATLDPELIVLDGSVGRALSARLPSLETRVGSCLPVPPRLVVSSLGTDATAIGAIAAALEVARSRRAPQSFFDSVGFHVGRAARGARTSAA